MNYKIKAAAEAYNEGEYDETAREEGVMAFAAGADYFRKESGVEELREAAMSALCFIMELDSMNLVTGWTGLPQLRAALSKSDLFFNDKNLKDDK